MLAPFLTFINHHKLDLKKQTCLLTVSGGVDSVVMLHLFEKAGFSGGVAHCNFGLRGEESDGDEKFVEELSKSYEFPFFSHRFEVKSFAKEKGISTQMAARELRYQWFEELREANEYTYIATAHHANDSLETTLLNLTRGTGLSGLNGISGLNKHLLRPLLLATKEEILAYALENQLHWREDRSNDTDDYKRNVIRHKVIPVLKQLNPSLEATFKNSSEKLRSADELLKNFLDTWASHVVTEKNGQIRISVAAIMSENEPAYRLWHILQDFGFTFTQAASIVDSLGGISGKVFQSATHTLLVDRQDLILQENHSTESSESLLIQEDENEVRFAGQHIEFEKTNRDATEAIIKSSISVSIKYEKLIFPLQIREWKSGDIFQPMGMNGRRKKLSNLFIDAKMDRFAKERTLVLLNGDGAIIWVVGVRLDERFRLSEDTTEVLRATLRNFE